MTAPGQLDLDGNEAEDPRVEKAAKALWYRDAKATWGQDGPDIAREQAQRLWPRMRGQYMAAALVAITAADKTC